MIDVEPPAPNSQHAAKDDPERRASKKKRNLKPSTVRWIIMVTGWTFVISMALSLLSNSLVEGMGTATALIVLLLFILLGIAFDILGVAVATADEKPFHSMAARRVKGAQESLRLVRRADKVSNFCNDVVGDISGIISGATTAVVAASFIERYSWQALATNLIFSAVVASLTVGGKAFGKTVAMEHNTAIVHAAGQLVHHVRRIRRKLRHKLRRRTEDKH